MSSATIYATDVVTNNLKAASNTYNDLLIATSADSVLGGTSAYIGANYDTKYFVRQHLVSFDLSSVPSGSTITVASFSVKTSSLSIEAPTAGAQLELVPYNWGSTIEIADYLTKAEYSAIAAVATYPLTASVATDQVLTFTSGAPLIANLLAGGTSKFMLCNKAFRDGTSPTGFSDQSVKIYTSSYATASFRPTLALTYTAGGGGGTTYNATFFGSNF